MTQVPEGTVVTVVVTEDAEEHALPPGQAVAMQTEDALIDEADPVPAANVPAIVVNQIHPLPPSLLSSLYGTKSTRFLQACFHPFMEPRVSDPKRVTIEYPR
jgi:hypothetical protein